MAARTPAAANCPRRGVAGPRSDSVKPATLMTAVRFKGLIYGRRAHRIFPACRAWRCCN